jgi:hypothetical protein
MVKLIIGYNLNKQIAAEILDMNDEPILVYNLAPVECILKKYEIETKIFKCVDDAKNYFESFRKGV